MLLTLLACMPNEARYLARKAFLTDDDGDGVSDYQGDCDDADSDRFPGNPEVCDDTDNDCDGLKDEDPGTTPWYPDDDLDGYGDEARANYACDTPAGYIPTAGDCDDADIDVNPAGTEACNDYDDDCNGRVDEAGAEGEQTYYYDADDDGYATYDYTKTACEQPDGYIPIGEVDCEPLDPTTHPGAEDICNDGIDNDCDASDDTHECVWFEDYSVEDVAWAKMVNGFEGEFFGLYPTVLDGSLAIWALESGGSSDMRGAVYQWEPVAGLVSGSDHLWVYGEAGAYLSPPAAMGEWYLFGAPLASNYAGQLRRVPSDHTGEVNEAHLWVEGSEFSLFGLPEAVVDINGDTIDDVIVEATFDSTGGPNYGAIWFVPQNQPLGSTTGDLENAIFGDASTASLSFGGKHVTGDIDGDGIDDLTTGTEVLEATYTFNGPIARGFSTVADADTVLATANPGDYFGSSISVLPDMTGDGIQELVIGAMQADCTINAYQSCGNYSLISGLASGERVAQEERYTWFEGGGTGYQIGHASSAGDVNNDGEYDLILGGSKVDYGSVNETGTVYVNYGPISASRLPLADDASGAYFHGASAEDWFGLQVLSGYDFNGDGTHDIVASSEVYQTDGVAGGAVFIIPGSSL